MLMSTEQAPRVHTAEGWIEGVRHPKLDIYLGIPYAAPPIGDLRWKAPRNVEDWEGVYQAKAFKSPSAQLGNIYGTSGTELYGQLVGSEDSLYLNVWAPITDSSQKRPVLVFIHGGSNTRGTASDPIYEASRLAEETGAIVVTVNYRLAFFGALYHPALHTGDSIDDSGNYVTLDLIKALEWVRRNIAKFGGDSDNVTIQGHSAGCMNVWGLIHSNLATGLFHKAIAMSGFPQLRSTQLAEQAAEELITSLLMQDGLITSSKEADSYKRQMGLTNIREYLLSKDTAAILQAAKGVKQISHIRDGNVLPLGNKKELQLAVPVPMIIGTVRNEASLLLIHGYKDQKRLWEEFNARNPHFTRKEFMKLPAYLSYKLKCKLFDQILHYWFDNKLMRKVTDIPHPIYQYKFSWNELPQPWRAMFGSFHGLDVISTFGTFLSDRPNLARFVWSDHNRESREALHKQMIDTFKGFLESGDPNLYRQDRADWKPLSHNSRNFMQW